MNKTVAGLLLTACACNRESPTSTPVQAASEPERVMTAASAPLHYRIVDDEIVFSDEATDEDMAVLDAHPHLKGLSFARGPGVRPPVRLTAKGLVHLGAVKQLERLQLDDVSFTDDALAPVASLTDLRELWLDLNERLTDRVLVHVAPLENLRVLRFHKADITDAGLLHIQRLTKLEDLQLGHSRVTDQGLAVIARFAELRTLDLQHTAVTDRGMEQLRGLKQLRWLCLNGTAVSGQVLASIEGLTELESFFAERTAIDDASLARLAGLTKLDALDLSGTKVTDAGMVHLARLPGLQRLKLDDCAIGDRGLRALAEIGSLKSLSLRGGTPSRAVYDSVRAARPDLEITGVSPP